MWKPVEVLAIWTLRSEDLAREWEEGAGRTAAGAETLKGGARPGEDAGRRSLTLAGP